MLLVLEAVTCWQGGRGAVGAKNWITNNARMSFVGRNLEFGKTEELFNSLGRLCFAEGRVAKTARAL